MLCSYIVHSIYQPEVYIVTTFYMRFCEIIKVYSFIDNYSKGVNYFKGVQALWYFTGFSIAPKIKFPVENYFL